MGIKAEEKPEWAIGKKIHRIIQDHVSGKKPDPRFKHIKYTFPIVEEVEFDGRCRFEFELNPLIRKIGKIKGTYKIMGFFDGLDYENKRFLEIKSSDPIWSISRFEQSFQRKLYSLAEPDFTEAILITCSKDESKWEREQAKVYSVPLTERDRLQALDWITAGIRVLEAGNFTSDLVDGKCVDKWCYWGANCQFK